MHFYIETWMKIYMEMPPGLASQGEYPSSIVCKLNKSLYGLKQAFRQWFLKFSNVILGFGLTQSRADHSLFYKNIDGKYLGLIMLMISCWPAIVLS